MEENLKTEEQAAKTILQRGVRYKLGKETISIRPLYFGTILSICERICQAGLTEKEIEEGEANVPPFLLKYGQAMVECVAIAELNDRNKLSEKEIASRAGWYRDTLTAMQIYELFIFVVNLSGIQAFTNTIRLIWTLKQTNLSPTERKGS